MDDGYLDKKKYPLLMTDGYDDESVCLLIKAFEMLGIKTFKTTHNRIRIHFSSRSSFFNLIKPYIHESMRYKMP